LYNIPGYSSDTSQRRNFFGASRSNNQRVKEEEKLKRNWELDELIESWTLLPHELELLDSKIGANRLGFAVLLKFFELAHKFPSSPQDVPLDMANASLEQPDGTVKEVIYPVASEQTLKDLVKEFKASGTAYWEKVHTVIRSSYSRQRNPAKAFTTLSLRFRDEYWTQTSQ
jgi:hypothetical protein